jgi:hypothetical protein
MANRENNTQLSKALIELGAKDTFRLQDGDIVYHPVS